MRPIDRPSIPRELLRQPTVAWPTLALFVIAWSLWAMSVWAASTGAVPTTLAVLGCAIAAYVMFTPLHEAAHRAATKSVLGNDFIGHLSALLLGAPFAAMRAFHLEHHRHTNDPDKDPDVWSGQGPALLLPLRWATQDLHYYARFVLRPPALSRAERVEVSLVLVLLVGILAVAGSTGLGRELLLFWIVPARLAILALSFALDYLPHRPHDTPARVDRFAATRATPGRVAAVLQMGHNLHLVHHLYPAVPFYRYGRIWRALEMTPR